MATEGNSIRATVRMTGVAKNTVTKLLVDMGTVCSAHQDRVMRDLTCERLQVDEIWSFVYAKQKNVPAEKRGEAGDVWTRVALDADTKLVPSYRIGARDLAEATAFMSDVASRVRNRPQITTDGHAPYRLVVAGAFGGQVDHAMLVKVYGNDNSTKPERRYSPGVCLEAIPHRVHGNPDPSHIFTSYVERQNLTMRMGMRRYTRLTNAFSKKIENLAAAVSLHFAQYNFCRVHKTLGTTPAVAAGVTDHVWTLQELIGLLEEAESVSTKRGSYSKTRVVEGQPRFQTDPPPPSEPHRLLTFPLFTAYLERKYSCCLCASSVYSCLRVCFSSLRLLLQTVVRRTAARSSSRTRPAS